MRVCLEALTSPEVPAATSAARELAALLRSHLEPTLLPSPDESLRTAVASASGSEEEAIARLVADMFARVVAAAAGDPRCFVDRASVVQGIQEEAGRRGRVHIKVWQYAWQGLWFWGGNISLCFGLMLLKISGLNLSFSLRKCGSLRRLKTSFKGSVGGNG